MALVMVFIQGGAIGRLVKVFGETKLVVMGTAFMTVSLFLASVSQGLTLFVTFLLFQALGYAMTNPSLSSLASRNAAAGTQGATLGVYQSAGSLARVIGPLSAGFLFDHLGMQVPFWVASGLFALSCLIVLFKRSTWGENSSEKPLPETVVNPHHPEPSPS